MDQTWSSAPKEFMFHSTQRKNEGYKQSGAGIDACKSAQGWCSVRSSDLIGGFEAGFCLNQGSEVGFGRVSLEVLGGFDVRLAFRFNLVFFGGGICFCLASWRVNCCIFTAFSHELYVFTLVRQHHQHRFQHPPHVQPTSPASPANRGPWLPTSSAPSVPLRQGRLAFMYAC